MNNWYMISIFLAGYGGYKSLKDEINELGLSTESAKTLLKAVCGGKAAISCNIG